MALEEPDQLKDASWATLGMKHDKLRNPSAGFPSMEILELFRDLYVSKIIINPLIIIKQRSSFIDQFDKFTILHLSIGDVPGTNGSFNGNINDQSG